MNIKMTTEGAALSLDSSKLTSIPNSMIVILINNFLVIGGVLDDKAAADIAKQADFTKLTMSYSVGEGHTSEGNSEIVSTLEKKDDSPDEVLKEEQIYPYTFDTMKYSQMYEKDNYPIHREFMYSEIPLPQLLPWDISISNAYNAFAKTTTRKNGYKMKVKLNRSFSYPPDYGGLFFVLENEEGNKFVVTPDEFDNMMTWGDVA